MSAYFPLPASSAALVLGRRVSPGVDQGLGVGLTHSGTAGKIANQLGEEIQLSSGSALKGTNVLKLKVQSRELVVHSSLP